MQTLIKAQRERIITVKPNDKSGGCSILNLPDYVDACHSHLYSTFTDEHGQVQQYYRDHVPQQILNHHWAQVNDLVSEGVEAGYVHPDDVTHLVPPEPKPGRFYGLVKNHVEPDQWSGPIPPLRPIVSGSGCNTEGISQFVDEFAKGEVKKLDSWLEDTRHLLQIVSEENAAGPQQPGTIPVTLDISGMYNNVPFNILDIYSCFTFTGE